MKKLLLFFMPKACYGKFFIFPVLLFFFLIGPLIHGDEFDWRPHLVPNYPNSRGVTVIDRSIVNGVPQSQHLLFATDALRHVVNYYRRQMRYKNWEEIRSQRFAESDMVITPHQAGGLQGSLLLVFRKHISQRTLYYNIQFLDYDRHTIAMIGHSEGEISYDPGPDGDVPGSDPLDFIRHHTMNRTSSIIISFSRTEDRGFYTYNSTASKELLLDYYLSRMQDLYWHEDPVFRWTMTEEHNGYLFLKENLSMWVIVSDSDEEGVTSNVSVLQTVNK